MAEGSSILTKALKRTNRIRGIAASWVRQMSGNATSHFRAVGDESAGQTDKLRISHFISQLIHSWVLTHRSASRFCQLYNSSLVFSFSSALSTTQEAEFALYSAQASPHSASQGLASAESTPAASSGLDTPHST
jgi:hypothetical protein